VFNFSRPGLSGLLRESYSKKFPGFDLMMFSGQSLIIKTEGGQELL